MIEPAKLKHRVKQHGVKVTKTKRYRETKRHMRRARAILKLDRGNVEQTISVTFPLNSTLSDREHTYEKNPACTRILLGTVTIVFYSDSERGFVYDCDGIYAGGFEKHDLKWAFFKFGALLKAVQN